MNADSAMFLVTLRRCGPRYDHSKPLEPWTIRLDARVHPPVGGVGTP